MYLQHMHKADDFDDITSHAQTLYTDAAATKHAVCMLHYITGKHIDLTHTAGPRHGCEWLDPEAELNDLRAE